MNNITTIKNNTSNSDTCAQFSILGQSYHLGDKIDFILKKSGGHVVGSLLDVTPIIKFGWREHISNNIITYTVGLNSNATYFVREKDIAKVDFKQDYSGNSGKEFDWE